MMREVDIGEGEGEGAVTYVVSLSWVLKMVRCPVTGCPEVAHSAGQLREHFMYRHFFSMIAVVQEGKDLIPLCNWCGIHMTAGRMNKHQRIQWCERSTQIRWCRRDVAIQS